MKRTPYSLIWLIIFAVILAFLYFTRAVLLPFVVALIVAYFLNPLTTWLERKGLGRTVATLVISALFFLLIGGGLTLLMPVLYEQALVMMQVLPEYINHVSERFLPVVQHNVETFSPDAAEKVRASLGDISAKALALLSGFLVGMWNSGVAILNVVSLLVLTPIVTFYMLRDWNRIVHTLSSWLPPVYAPVIREQCHAIDKTLAAYIRGQTNVCLLLGIFYAVGLSLVHLRFGLVVGLLTGLLSFVPFLGVGLGLIVALILAVVQFGGEMQPILMVVSVFAFGQFLEGNFITPKLIGDRVGLHPVWVIFGMLSGAALFGFVGVLIAVPVTAVAGVLLRFSVQRYLQSALYRGGEK